MYTVENRDLSNVNHISTRTNRGRLRITVGTNTNEDYRDPVNLIDSKQRGMAERAYGSIDRA